MSNAIVRRIEQWEQQPGEASDIFSCFAQFRDMGPSRTLGALAQQTGVALSTLKDRSARHHWMDRCRAYDAHLDRVRLAAVEDDAAARAKASRDAVTLLGKTVQLELTKLLDEARKSEFSAMKVNTLIKATDYIVRLQRLIDGQSTENFEHRGHLSYENLSDDELGQLEKISRKVIEQ